MYEEKVYPTEINIYETYNAGGTKSISAKADNGEWVTLYKADKIEAIKSSRILKPRLIVSSPFIHICLLFQLVLHNIKVSSYASQVIYGSFSYIFLIFSQCENNK